MIQQPFAALGLAVWLHILVIVNGRLLGQGFAPFAAGGVSTLGGGAQLWKLSPN